MNGIACLLDLGSGQTLVNAAHEEHVVVSTARNQSVAPLNKLVGHFASIQLHLFNVILEFGGLSLLKLGSQSSYGMVMRSTLQAREDREINLIFNFPP